MARTRTFNPNEALRKAQTTFHIKGYHATSLDLLLNAMSLSKSSLYSVWPDKLTLFHQSLQLALSDAEALCNKWLTQSKPAIETLLEIIAAPELSEVHQYGFFILQAGSDLSLEDETVKGLVQKGAEQYTNTLVELIRRGQQDRTIRGDITPTHLAALFYQQICGINTMRRAGHESKDLELGLVCLFDVLQTTP